MCSKHVEARNKLIVKQKFCASSWLITEIKILSKSFSDKAHPRTGQEGPEGEYKYSSTLSLTSALDMVGGQRHAPAALPPEKTRYPTYRRLGGPRGRSGRVRKISSPTGIRSPDRPARIKSLYRLSYPVPRTYKRVVITILWKS